MSRRVIFGIGCLLIFEIFNTVAAKADELSSPNTQAYRLYKSGRYEEAIVWAERYLAAARRIYKQPHRRYAEGLSNIAQMYTAQGRYADAEPLARELVEVELRLVGPNHRSYAESLVRLGWLYSYMGRFAEAEPLYQRTWEIVVALTGEENSDAGEALSTIAGNHDDQGRLDKAETAYLRALEILSKTKGSNHILVAQTLNNLAMVYPDDRVEEALEMQLGCVKIMRRQKRVPDDQMDYAIGMLGYLYNKAGNLSAAEPLLIQAADLIKKALGPEHRITEAATANLAGLYYRQGKFLPAYSLYKQATSAAVERTRRGAVDKAATTSLAFGRESARSGETLIGQASAAFELAQRNPSALEDLRRESFALSQWAQYSEAASAISKAAVRLAAGDDDLASLIRGRQDLLVKRGEISAQMTALIGQNRSVSRARLDQLRSVLNGLDQQISDADQDIAAAPGYSNLSTQEPESFADVSQSLRNDEVLIQYGFDKNGGLLWLISKSEILWARVSLSSNQLTSSIQALRCGLDEEEWSTASQARRCAHLLGLTDIPAQSRPLPFHLAKAHELYQALFGEVESLIAGKTLFVVASGPLTSLPLHVLVTQKPTVALPDTFDGYRNVAWLGRQAAIVMLPSVSSLKTSRQNAGNSVRAAQDYAGYGNPVLAGDGVDCRLPKVAETCPSSEVISQEPPHSSAFHDGATVRGRGGRRSATTDEVFAKGAGTEAVLQQVRALCPLPDTAYEIKCVADRFKDTPPLIRLEHLATETEIKAMSVTGQLGRYRVLHFATHGLLSGDVERMALRQGEPALVLTPPDSPANADDDGLLMASEVATLRLNADWVVLSACNTAAGDNIGAPALSGLARAFFYAGGRTLLVSHWPVYSDAAVRLTTTAFAELDRDPEAGRAEALQRAMTALMDDRSQVYNAHPAVWAPFFIVGEGER